MNNGIQLVTRLYDAFAAGDIPGFLGHLSPEIVWNEAEGNPLADGNPYLGADAIVAGVFARLLAEWNDFGVEVQEIVGGDEVVTMFGRYKGVHAASGKPLDVQASHTWWIQGDKVVRFQQMVDTASMAAAAGQ
ncbi:MAG: ketosteroid isomerase-like protein [Planctomycetota bacterium]|jgi:ketosteroid isomerase-like protein